MTDPTTPADRILVQQADFDIAAEYQRLCEHNAADGAVVFFVGRVRDLNEGDPVFAMTLEHYPGMTEKALQQIVDDARQRWTLGRISVIHRFGELHPADQIVFVAVSSRHRDNAFEAARFIMDFLKSQAPFWKKERISNEHGSEERWVDAREHDHDALLRWNPKESG